MMLFMLFVLFMLFLCFFFLLFRARNGKTWIGHGLAMDSVLMGISYVSFVFFSWNFSIISLLAIQVYYQQFICFLPFFYCCAFNKDEAERGSTSASQALAGRLLLLHPCDMWRRAMQGAQVRALARDSLCFRTEAEDLSVKCEQTQSSRQGHGRSAWATKGRGKMTANTLLTAIPAVLEKLK